MSFKMMIFFLHFNSNFGGISSYTFASFQHLFIGFIEYEIFLTVFAILEKLRNLTRRTKNCPNWFGLTAKIQLTYLTLSFVGG